ncbi:NADPH-dependent FMN reductase [Nocardioides sp. R1-1]|uniref:NADPH-dependent FMN reductase n=1 Tax=Nocardioides sp. R1-1 TaxID=3383502 RepID=UPI0038CF7A6B
MDQLNLAIIIASTREGRLAPRITEWFVPTARQHGRYAVDVIDLQEVDLPAALTDSRPPAVESYLARLARADAFVVVTPEYNRGYPASLKQAIDIAFEEWQRKPVAFVSYGGVSGGLRAAEQLRQVFAELHAVAIRDGVCLPNCWSTFGAGAVPEGADAAAKTMLDQLDWWASALRSARAADPHAA